MIDSLFTHETMVLHCTQVGQILRDNRKMFLHHGVLDKFKGYAYAQVHKMQTKTPEPGSKRAQLREQFGMDVKFGYHVVRLLAEAEQILLEGDLDLQRNREQLKRVELESARAKSPLPPKPDMDGIRDLLLRCLEMHYGSLDRCVVVPGRAEALLKQIRESIEGAGY